MGHHCDVWWPDKHQLGVAYLDLTVVAVESGLGGGGGGGERSDAWKEEEDRIIGTS